MKKIFSWLLLGICFSFFIQVPFFVSEYEKEAQNRIVELKENLKFPLQNANKNFAGNMDKLIEYWESIPDEKIQKEARDTKNAFSRLQTLTKNLQSFENNHSFGKLLIVLIQGDGPTIALTFQTYRFQVRFEYQYFEFYGFAILLSHLIGLGVIGLVGRIFRKTPPPAPIKKPTPPTSS